MSLRKNCPNCETMLIVEQFMLENDKDRHNLYMMNTGNNFIVQQHEDDGIITIYWCPNCKRR